MNKFEIAEKYISAILIKNLFPDTEGYEEKGEWWIKSPIRVDTKVGSFSINLNTGLYRDFANDDKGSKGRISYLVNRISKTGKI